VGLWRWRFKGWAWEFGESDTEFEGSGWITRFWESRRESITVPVITESFWSPDVWPMGRVAFHGPDNESEAWRQEVLEREEKRGVEVETWSGGMNSGEFEVASLRTRLLNRVVIDRERRRRLGVSNGSIGRRQCVQDRGLRQEVDVLVGSSQRGGFEQGARECWYDLVDVDRGRNQCSAYEENRHC
jgi:hypothetical protein